VAPQSQAYAETMRRTSVYIAVAASIAGLAVAAFLYTRERDRKAAADGWLGREAAAVYWLKHLASAQSRVRTDRAIDADRDGIGEYATLLELKGAVGVRRGFTGPQGDRQAAADFSKVGDPLDLTTEDVSMYGLPGNVDATGVVTQGGYHYRAFLPDSGTSPGWTHEAGPAGVPGFAGGTSKVGIDAAERQWCAIAWPDSRGESGDRVYFVDETGVVLESENTVARWSGLAREPTPDCARAAAGAGDAPPSGGHVGRDGDRWTPWDSSRLRTRLREPRRP